MSRVATPGFRNSARSGFRLCLHPRAHNKLWGKQHSFLLGLLRWIYTFGLSPGHILPPVYMQFLAFLSLLKTLKDTYSRNHHQRIAVNSEEETYTDRKCGVARQLLPKPTLPFTWPESGAPSPQVTQHSPAGDKCLEVPSISQLALFLFI